MNYLQKIGNNISIKEENKELELKMKQKLTRKKFKERNGITLIALVVTIVVLLILAGITINYVFSEGGLFDTAKNSGNTWHDAENSDLNALNEVNGMVGNLVNGGTTTPPEPEDTTPPEPEEATLKLADGSTVTLTEENYGEYLGRKVNYIPESPSTEYATSATYRIFYIDFAEKYGEKGAVYLKADCDDKIKSLSSYTSHTSTDNYAVMKALNPSWTKPETMQTSDYCVSWILDPDVWKNWKDTTTVGIVGNINYVVGAPSLEMYVDSYNKYLDTHTGLVKNGGTNPAQKLACEYVTSGYRAKGYRIGFADVASGSWANTGYYQAENSLISSSEANGMYNPGSSKYYWLASPSTYDSNTVMLVNGICSRVDNGRYDNTNALCPIVSLKSSVQLKLID